MFDYEFTPEEAHYHYQQLVDKQFEVFGESRMKESFGNEADEADAESFTKTIETLCHEAGPREPDNRSYLRRVIRRETEPDLVLWGNPEDHHGFGNTGEIDRPPAAVRDLKKGSLTILKPKNGLSPGKYTTLEHLFIDRLTGEAKIEKEIIPRTRLGSYKSAIKNATKTEVDEALAIIAHAVAQEERNQ